MKMHAGSFFFSSHLCSVSVVLLRGISGLYVVRGKFYHTVLSIYVVD